MPRLLIAGCGFLGEAAAAFFSEGGWDVLGLTLTGESAARRRAGASYRVEALDFTKPGELESRGLGGFDAVIHCASSGRGGAEAYGRVYREGIRNLAEAFPSSRIVFVGSTSVYAQTDGSVVGECSPVEPVRETGRILLESEGATLARGGVVLRLAGLYGPGRSVLMRRYLDGTARIEDGGCRWINQIHRDDAVAACRVAVDAESGIYNVSDGTPATQRDVYGWLAEHFGGELPPAGAADTERKRGLTNKRVSNSRLCGAGWRPRFSSYRLAIPSVAASFVD